MDGMRVLRVRMRMAKRKWWWTAVVAKVGSWTAKMLRRRRSWLAVAKLRHRLSITTTKAGWNCPLWRRVGASGEDAVEEAVVEAKRVQRGKAGKLNK